MSRWRYGATGGAYSHCQAEGPLLARFYMFLFWHRAKICLCPIRGSCSVWLGLHCSLVGPELPSSKQASPAPCGHLCGLGTTCHLPVNHSGPVHPRPHPTLCSLTRRRCSLSCPKQAFPEQWLLALPDPKAAAASCPGPLGQRWRADPRTGWQRPIRDSMSGTSAAMLAGGDWPRGG